MLNKQKTSIFLIKKIKWEICPKQNKRSLGRKESQKKFQNNSHNSNNSNNKNGPKEVRIKIQI